MHVAKYLGMVRNGEQELAEALLMVSDRNENEADARDGAKLLAQWSRAHVEALGPLIEKYGEDSSADPDRLRSALFHGARVGGLGLLRDLEDLSALANHVRLGWTALHQAAQRLHDKELEAVSHTCGLEVDRQIEWMCTLLKHVSGQALVVPAEKDAELRGSLVKPPNPPSLPEAIWGPTAAGGMVLAVGLLAMLVGQQPWLVPSLGPTAYLVAENPGHPTSRFYNTVVGHLVGLGAGFLAVALLNAWQAPVVLTDHKLDPMRMLAAVIAIVLTIGVAPVLRASHPPAAATTLLVALGSLKTLNDAIMVTIGVLIIAVVGEGLRQVRLGQMRLDPPKQEARRPAPMPWLQRR
ncbi:MAG TPA: HPP family protein [Chloroflexia bacterium]|jgi:hypothetical protein